MKANYTEFSDQRLVSIYNVVNPIVEYKEFYLTLAKKLLVKTVVDVGCGTGLLTCELAKAGYKVIGIEPSSEMLGVARRSDCGKEVEWIVGDALELKPGIADLVIMTGHVAQFYVDDDYWKRALDSVHASLRPGGYFVFETRNSAITPWFSGWPTSKEDARVFRDPEVGEIKWWYEPVETNENRILYKNRYFLSETGEDLTSINELVFRSKNEMTSDLCEAGFKVETVYGNWDWNPASEDSPEHIFVAQK